MPPARRLVRSTFQLQGLPTTMPVVVSPVRIADFGVNTNRLRTYATSLALQVLGGVASLSTTRHHSDWMRLNVWGSIPREWQKTSCALAPAP